MHEQEMLMLEVLETFFSRLISRQFALVTLDCNAIARSLEKARLY
jgi:hypothetical protein